ncbi:hypothetical protein V8E36_008309 [Tilletia maclaganii]
MLRLFYPSPFSPSYLRDAHQAAGSHLTAAQKRKCLRQDLIQERYNIIFASPEMLLTNPDIGMVFSDPEFQSRAHVVFVRKSTEYPGVSYSRNFSLPHSVLRTNSPGIPGSSVKSDTTYSRNYSVLFLISNIEDMQNLLRIFKPDYDDFQQIPKTLIFVRTRPQAYRASALVHSYLGSPPPPRAVVRPFTSLSSDEYKISVMQKDFQVGGMGIDIPDIRVIVQYGLTVDLKSLNQHMGRAMRDTCDSGRSILFTPMWSLNTLSPIAAKLGYKVKKDKAAKLRRDNLEPGLNRLLNDCTCRRAVMVQSMQFEGSTIQSLHSDRPLRVLDDDAPPSASVCRIDSAGWTDPAEAESVLIKARAPSERLGSFAVCCDLCAGDDVRSEHLAIDALLAIRHAIASAEKSKPRIKAVYVPRPPPLEFYALQTELAASLDLWRRSPRQAKQRPAWQDMTSQLTDRGIVNMVAQARRLLAQHMYGGTPLMDRTYIRQLLHSQHVLLDDIAVDSLIEHRKSWLEGAKNKRGHLAGAFRLASMDELPRDPSSL